MSEGREKRGGEITREMEGDGGREGEGKKQKKRERERELVAICKRTWANGTHDFYHAQLGWAGEGLNIRETDSSLKRRKRFRSKQIPMSMPR